MRMGFRAWAAAALLGSTAFGAAADSRAQTSLPRVAVICPAKGLWLEQFEQALAARGLTPGKTVLLDVHVTGGDMARTQASVDEMVRTKVDVVYAVSAPVLRATVAATRSIPIVALDYTSDPVAAGYAESYGRPGRNVTGVFLNAPEFAVKWLESLKLIVPGLSRVAVLWDPAPGHTHLQAIQSVAGSFGFELQVLEVRNPQEIESAFSTLSGKLQALVILPSPMQVAQSAHLAKLALRHRLAATSWDRVFAEAGGALSYGPSTPAVVASNATQIAKVLSGAKPGDLPVEWPAKYEFVVNLRTIKALGLSVPDSVLLRADEVIR